jgi:FkbM family methyltransferase
MPNFSRLAARAQLALLMRLLDRMGPGNRAWLARHMMRDRRDPRQLAFADFAGHALDAWKNRQYDVHLNGEVALLAALAPFQPGVLLDVGANVGEWSIAACEKLPGARVHAFEIAPATAAILAENAAPLGARLAIHPIGLGEREGKITLFASSESNTASSTIREAIEVSAEAHGITTIEEVAARVTTGDRFLREAGIEHVDFLKIDVEGAEFSVLRGFSEAFSRDAIDIVQFEYGLINLRTRDFLEDYYKFFAERGFVVGKLFPEGVAFKEYAIEDEDFAGPNYIACRACRADLIAALRFPEMGRGR